MRAKKHLLIIAVFLFLVFNKSNAQATKYVLFEHYTQASCNPCAYQNEFFFDTILIPNPLTVRHISYQTAWPGYDPMNLHNPDEIGFRGRYYNVKQVPRLEMMGNQKYSWPSAFKPVDLATQLAKQTPIRIDVSQIDNGASRDAIIKISNVGGTVPDGSYYLWVAVIERNINYATPPGTNGETYFPNVFRKLLPDTLGIIVPMPTAGNSSTHTFTFNEHPVWNMSEIAVLAFVQNTSTKEILNVGSTFDPFDPTGLNSITAPLSIGDNYPNPASGITTIEHTISFGKQFIQVFDISGRMVINQEIFPGAVSSRIDVSTLETGVYFFQISEANRKSTAHKMHVVH